MHLDEVNFLAVALATVLAFVLGAAWYSPILFGRQWMAANGYTADKLQEMQQGAGKLYGVSAVCWFVMATVLALVAPHFGEGVGATFHMAVLLWFGFAATTGLTNNLFSDRPLRAWIIDAGYQIGTLALMSIVLGLWP